MHLFKKLYTRLPFLKELYATKRHTGELPLIRQGLVEMQRERLLATPRLQEPKRLARHEAQVFSQNGEDGIIAELVARVGGGDRFFVEIGASDGVENNTALLLSQGWRGIWVEGGRRECARIARSFRPELEHGRLRLVNRFVDESNIAGLLQAAAVPTEFALLSVDVDRNTYHLWAALARLRPRIVVVEYNAIYPPTMEFIAAYAAEKQWNGSSYFGASLKSYELLGAKLGYRLVGCDLTGSNAFFVREDLCGDRFCAPFTAENHYEPLRLHLLRQPGYPRCYRD